jgi:hypothetical protein
MRLAGIFASCDVMSNSVQARRVDCQPVRSGLICKESTLRIVPAEISFVRDFAVRRLSSGDRSQRHKGGSARPSPSSARPPPAATSNPAPPVSAVRLPPPPVRATGETPRSGDPDAPRSCAPDAPRGDAGAALPWRCHGREAERRAWRRTRRARTRSGENRIGSERFRLGRIQPRCARRAAPRETRGHGPGRRSGPPGRGCARGQG